MTVAVNLSFAGRQAACVAILALLPVGSVVDIYSGTQPLTPDTAPGMDTALLATVALANPPFTTPSEGAATATTPIPTVSAIATGVATWFRITDPSGNGVIDGSVGVGSSFAMAVNTTNFVIGVPVTISALPFMVSLTG